MITLGNAENIENLRLFEFCGQAKQSRLKPNLYNLELSRITYCVVANKRFYIHVYYIRDNVITIN